MPAIKPDNENDGQALNPFSLPIKKFLPAFPEEGEKEITFWCIEILTILERKEIALFAMSPLLRQK